MGRRSESGTESDESGVKATEIKFDGVDDYLKIENVDVEKSDGITYEFYGKNYGTEYCPLSKTLFNGDNIDLEKHLTGSFRMKRLQNGDSGLSCCFGVGNSGSDRSSPPVTHWINFSMSNNANFEYFSITIDFPKTNDGKAIINLYQEGVKIDDTTCDGEYLKNGDVFNGELCFTVGVVVSVASGSDIVGCADYGKFDLYACRLYTRVLSDTEINQNYIATTNYHNELVKK